MSFFQASLLTNEKEENIPVSVLHHGNQVDDTVTHETAWIEGAQLLIGQTMYQVELNVPVITSVKLPPVILSGVLELHFVHC